MRVPSFVPPRKGESNTQTVKIPRGELPGIRALRVSLESAHAEKPRVKMEKNPEDEYQGRLVCLGEKIGRLAHDIRNPLASIEWLASLLGRDFQSLEERKELSNHCIQAVRSLDHLVSNILVMSAPLHTRSERVELVNMIDEVELLVLYHLQKKRITLHRRHEGQVTTINGHGSLVKQGMLNLLMNAIQASEPDQTIEIYSGPKARAGNPKQPSNSQAGLVFSIRDYGGGMSEEVRSNMFRPFYSGRNGGTGLGLAIVKQIVHIHHGLIDITSHEGKGTTVELFFPQ